MFDRMPPEMLARVKGQAAKTNERNRLADQATGFATSRTDQRAAEQKLVREVGARKAKQLIKQARERAVKGGF